MEFQKYQHIERLDTTETKGIEYGICYVFPKIDGTNSQLWWNNGLQAGSRNRQLSLDSDNAGFYAWALEQEVYKRFFERYPTARLYGEWLVPHTLRTYENSAWRCFYVFDVIMDDAYLPYEDYKAMLVGFGINFIPPICKIENPSYDKLVELLDKNDYLIQDGKGVGEGIVIKNYDFVNRYGRVTWAKIVRNEFKNHHRKAETPVIKDKTATEQLIVNKFVTVSLISKELAKIETDAGWNSKQIPRLLNTVYYCLVKEESWNIVKEFKNPTIDYKRLYNLTVNKVKETCIEIF